MGVLIVGQQPSGAISSALPLHAHRASGVMTEHGKEPGPGLSGQSRLILVSSTLEVKLADFLRAEHMSLLLFNPLSFHGCQGFMVVCGFLSFFSNPPSLSVTGVFPNNLF